MFSIGSLFVPQQPASDKDALKHFHRCVSLFMDVQTASNLHNGKEETPWMEKQMFSDANITAGTTERDKGGNVKQHFTRKKKPNIIKAMVVCLCVHLETEQKNEIN